MLLSALLWTWLGAWLGAMTFFGSFTGVAFQVIPSPELAGQLVGRLLDPLLLTGAVSGLVLAALGHALGRGRLAVALPVVLAAACLFNQFGVSGAVAKIQLGDPGLLPADAARFATLHRLSVWLFVGTGLGALALAIIHARAELRAARAQHPRGRNPA